MITHRGFCVGDKEKSGYMALPVVDELYSHMATQHNWEDDKEYIKKVIVVARSSLFDKAGRFIFLNQLKPKVNHWVSHFSISTMKYIMTGRREMALENYRDLMVFHPTDMIDVDRPTTVTKNNLQAIYQLTPAEIIAMWLSREDGLTDMVQTLHLVWGSLPDNWEAS